MKTINHQAWLATFLGNMQTRPTTVLNFADAWGTLMEVKIEELEREIGVDLAAFFELQPLTVPISLREVQYRVAQVYINSMLAVPSYESITRDIILEAQALLFKHWIYGELLRFAIGDDKLENPNYFSLDELY